MKTAFFRKRSVIAYSVEAKAVTLPAIFYGGQDCERLLQEA